MTPQEKSLKRALEWQKNNPERRKEIRAKWIANNLEKMRAIRKAWKLKNKEKVREERARWMREHPEIRVANEAKRRARKLNAEGSFTKEQIVDLLVKQRNRCALCEKIVVDKYHRDHIVPLFLGGSNDIHNIQILCPECNLKKSYSDPIAYANKLGKLL